MAMMRDGELVDRWTTQQVKLVRKDLTDAECLQVLEAVASSYSAHEGVNWKAIEKQCARLFPVGGVKEKEPRRCMH